MIYVESVRDSAQVRLDLALALVAEEGIEATGEVGDYDPFLATMDAIAEHRPDEIIISTLPPPPPAGCAATSSSASRAPPGLPCSTSSASSTSEGRPIDTTLVVANRTASGED